MVKEISTSSTARSFKDLITGDSVYIDKTAPICDLASSWIGCILTRPHGMGKTTLVSTLEYLFSHGTVGTEGLACHELWDDPYRYFVIRLNWGDYKCTTADEFKDEIVIELQKYADSLGLNIEPCSYVGFIFKELVDDILSKLSDKNFLEQHPELSQGDRPLNTKKVVILIDDYDLPLTRNIGNEQTFEEIRNTYIHLFCTIKSLGCIRFDLHTGVTPYCLTTNFGGPNQYFDVTTLDDYATCCGYTSSEIEQYLAPQLNHAQDILQLSREELMERMRYQYAGYLFSMDNDESKRVSSPDAISSFLAAPEDGFKPYWSSTELSSTRLFNLLKLCNQSVSSSFFGHLPFSWPYEDKAIEINIRGYIDAWFPILGLTVVAQQSDDTAVLCGGRVERPVMHEKEKLDSVADAVSVLFHEGYLSVKRLNIRSATLGIATPAILSFLRDLVVDEYPESDDVFGILETLRYLKSHSDEVITSIHHGGQELAVLVDRILRTAPSDLFASENYAVLIAYLMRLAVRFAVINTHRYVELFSDRSAVLIYKPLPEIQTPDVLIEFKVAGESADVSDLLQKGCEELQKGCEELMARNEDGVDASALKRYCIVMSSELYGVGAIASMDANNEIVIEYQSDRLDAKGKVQS